MTKFNPADLTKEIPEEMIRSEQDQATEDFIAECKADKENGQLNLTLSLASTLALALHGHMSALLLGQGEDGKALKSMVDAAGDKGVTMALQIAPLALNLGLHRLMMADAKNQLAKDPLKLIAAAHHLSDGAKIAFDAAKKIAPDIEKALALARKYNDSDGSMSVKIDGMGTLHMRDRGPNKAT